MAADAEGGSRGRHGMSNRLLGRLSWSEMRAGGHRAVTMCESQGRVTGPCGIRPRGWYGRWNCLQRLGTRTVTRAVLEKCQPNVRCRGRTSPRHRCSFLVKERGAAVATGPAPCWPRGRAHREPLPLPLSEDAVGGCAVRTGGLEEALRCCRNAGSSQRPRRRGGAGTGTDSVPPPASCHHQLSHRRPLSHSPVHGSGGRARARLQRTPRVEAVHTVRWWFKSATFERTVCKQPGRCDGHPDQYSRRLSKCQRYLLRGRWSLLWCSVWLVRRQPHDLH